tara:strand:+ start:67 stop:318 length:252 start_codon:yes stop_codon:yes gene_type:complete
MGYTFDDISRSFQVQNVAHAYRGISANLANAKDRLQHEQFKKTNDFIKKLRKRPVKQNIDVAQHEYQIVFNQLQRKQKLCPQY